MILGRRMTIAAFLSMRMTFHRHLPATVGLDGILTLTGLNVVRWHAHAERTRP